VEEGDCWWRGGAEADAAAAAAACGGIQPGLSLTSASLTQPS